MELADSARGFCRCGGGLTHENLEQARVEIPAAQFYRTKIVPLP
ncbi:hypothetical protein [Alkalibacterium subtropicum]|nr:hypothetical protein [Alkalibacterium subtropicum]